MTTSCYTGQRLSYDGALCTVRYQGSLPGAKGDWLGVEWDRADRGKHNGNHQGHRIFRCLSKSPNAASFIRPTRKTDPTRTVVEALKYKYGSKPAANGTTKPGVCTDAEIVHISGKAVEEVGFDKIQKQIGQFEELKVVLLDDLKVFGLTRDNSSSATLQASREFAQTCPNITELDLGWNLIEDVQTVAHICKHLLRLRILKASGLRLSSFRVESAGSQSPFSNVEELHLNETLLIPDQIISILDCTTKAAFPQLKALSLSLNELTNFSTNQAKLTFPTIATLILENNEFTTFSPLSSIFTHFPSLVSLSLQGNHISSIGTLPPTASFPTLNHLSLADNAISDFPFLSSLPRLFPSLTSLRISKNPFYATLPASAPSDASYYLTLARIPSLQTLNYTTISPRDREEGEIYYLSVAEKDMKSVLATQGLEAATIHTSSNYSRYAELCIKYDRLNILLEPPLPTNSTAAAPQYPPGSLASRVVHCKFYIPPSFSSTDATPESQLIWTRPIPKTVNAYTFKSLVHRHFGLAPLQFRLIYESTELDPIPETTRKMWSTKEDWERWGDFDVDIPPPGSAARPPREDNDGEEGEGKEKWLDGILYKDGVKWRRRETEIVEGMRSWGDFLDGGEREARFRVEPRDEKWEKHIDEWRKDDMGS